MTSSAGERRETNRITYSAHLQPKGAIDDLRRSPTRMRLVQSGNAYRTLGIPDDVRCRAADHAGPRPAVQIIDLVRPGAVAVGLRVRDQPSAMRKLARLAAKTSSLDPDLACAAVMMRKNCHSYGHRGVALVHAQIPAIFKPTGAFAVFHRAVDFGAADGEPIDLAFLLLSPVKDDAAHLLTLACAARRLRDRDLRKRLRSARDSDAAYLLLTTEDWRGRHDHGADL
jgi:PTS system nitrogen regulatory IIA component